MTDRGSVMLKNKLQDKNNNSKTKTTIKICTGGCCGHFWTKENVKKLENNLGVKLGESDLNKSLSLYEVDCLGNCECGPNIMINKKLYDEIDDDKLDCLNFIPA